MDISVQVEGLGKIEQATRRVREEIAKELARGMLASTVRVEGDAKKIILNGQKSGREYKRGNVTHRASAPGEAPASDTGLLVNSIRGKLDKDQLQQGQLEGTVTVGASYGRPLEFGTSKMGARPFLFPALEKNKQWIKDRLDKSVRDAVIRVTKE